MKQEEKELYAAGPLYKALTEYKKLDLATPSPLSILTTISNPVENRFRDALGKERAESEEGESTDETLSEAGEEMEVGIRQSRTQLKGISPHRSCSGT